MADDNEDKPDWTLGELPPEVSQALEVAMSEIKGGTPFEELGTFVHVAVEAYESVGHSHRDALYICMALMTGNPGLPPGNTSG